MQTFWDNVLRIIAVIGLIAVLLLGAWGIIQIAFWLPSFFGNFSGSTTSLFNSSAPESLTVSVPMSVTAGQTFTLNWRHVGGGSDQYSYSVSYSCASGLSVLAPVPTGSYSAVQCNTPFNYINASSSMPLTAQLTSGTQNTQVTFSVTATKLSTGAVTVSGNAGTTVSPAKTSTPAKTTTTTTKASPTSTYYPSGRVTNLYGYPDLAVSITSAYSQSGRASVQFVIENIGTNVARAGWGFNAVLPIDGGYTYPVSNQQALYPGDKIVYSMGYSDTGYAPYNQNCQYYQYNSNTQYQTYPYTYSNQYSPQYQYGTSQYQYPCSGGNYYYAPQTVTIEIDPYNLVQELTKYNNTASATYYGY